MGREAVILAGGKGTRLKTLVSDRPKPMALINGKPFLSYLANYLSMNKFSHIIFSIGYKHELIQEYFGENFKGMEISYAVEEKPLGTGGGILNAVKFANNTHTFILNGDTYFPVSFKKMENLAKGKDSGLVMALRQLEDDYGG